MSLEEKIQKKATADKKEEMKILRNIEKLIEEGKQPLLYEQLIEEGKQPLLYEKLIE